jgi:hypothetical protein
MFELKWKKYTYLSDNGQLYFGHRGESSRVYFSHLMQKGHDISEPKNGPVKYHMTPDYENADYLTYYHYLNGGYTEKIIDYDIDTLTFNSQ